MANIPEIDVYFEDLVNFRRDLHAHPELGFTEFRTAGAVVQKLEGFGVDEIHRFADGTGVVAVIHGRTPGDRSIGLRADMDALPIHEDSGVSYSSRHPGVMHACGHDAHTAMLVGAARYLSSTRNFSGRAVLIFQPAEEGLGGARRMITEGLFERFRCDELYGLHNDPGMPLGRVSVKPGVAMAGATFFDIRIKGAGSHAARPHQSKDPIFVGASLIQLLQSVVSRNLPPDDVLVLSVTAFNAGSTYNVIPGEACARGTLRYFNRDVLSLAMERISSICDGLSSGFDVKIEIEFRDVFDVLVNDQGLSSEYINVAKDIVGEKFATLVDEKLTGSEDFADMLKLVPGSYCRIGHSGPAPLHSPSFVLDEFILPIGASIYSRIVEARCGFMQ